MTLDDDAPTPEEIREAELLARALDGDRAARAAPSDALETALLLRYAKSDSLTPARHDAVLKRALSFEHKRARVRRVAVYGSFALAAAALVFLTVGVPVSRDAPLPPPPRALLEAELEATASNGASLSALALRTSDYRSTVYASMRERYSR